MTSEQQVRQIVKKRIPHFSRYVTFSFLLEILIQFITLIPPIIMQRIIDVYIVEKQIAYTIGGIVACVLIPLLSSLLTTYYNFKLNAVGRNMGAELTLLATEKLIYQPVSYFKDKKSSELVSYCNGESMKYIVFWLFDMPELFASLLMGIVVYIYIFIMNIPSGLVLILYVPLMLLPSNFFAKKAQGLIRHVVKNNGIMSQMLNDTLRGIKFIKAFAIEKLRLEQIKKVNQDTVSVWTKMVVFDNLSGMWTNSIMDQCFTGIIFGIMAFSIIWDKTTVGMLLVMLNYLPHLFQVVRKATNTNFKFQKQLAEYDNLFQIILLSDEREQETGTQKFHMDKNISIENLSFRYEEGEDSLDVLHNASMDIHKGEWVGIVGESGAGKSTLFQLLVRFYQPTSGRICVDGVSLEDYDIVSLRRNITFVSQDTFLFPGTIRDNLLMVRQDAEEEELLDVIKQVGLEELLDRDGGLDSVVGENGIVLSGGQKQRLALAQGLLQNSRVLLLDEVTANVDSKLEASLRQCVKRLQKQKELTVISISHRMAFLEDADRIYELKAGELQEIAGLCERA